MPKWHFFSLINIRVRIGSVLRHCSNSKQNFWWLSFWSGVNWWDVHFLACTLSSHNANVNRYFHLFQNCLPKSHTTGLNLLRLKPVIPHIPWHMTGLLVGYFSSTRYDFPKPLLDSASADIIFFKSLSYIYFFIVCTAFVSCLNSWHV